MSPTPDATVVEVFSPFTTQGALAKGIAVVKHTTATCQTSNLLARSDALRCFGEGDDHEIRDPCFRGGYPERVVCAHGPGDVQAVEVKVVGPLPTPDPQESLTSGSPWFVTLEDGQVCGELGGATDAIGGQRLNYGCKNGDLYGDVDRSTALWTIFYRANDAATLHQVKVVKATF